MPVDPNGLTKAIEAIKKKYGGDAISENAKGYPSIDRISTGSLALDFATAGGIPLGRISRLWGGWSSGKSLVCWSTIRHAQAKGLVCAYYNVEKQYDPKYVTDLGIDTEKLILVNGTTIEELGTKCEALMSSVHVHVIDSASSAASVDELNASIEDWQRGLGPRAWGKVLRHWGEAMDPTENAILIVDQARDTFGYAGGEHPPGGKMMEHASSMTLHFKRGKWLFRTKQGGLSTDETDKHTSFSDASEPAGFEMQIRCVKSRVGTPLRSVRLWYDAEKRQFDLAEEYRRAAILTKIVDKNHSWYTLPDGSKVQGDDALKIALTNDADLRKRIRRELMKVA